MITRATHRVITPDRPTLYCLRESDATTTAEQRLPASSVVEVLCVPPGQQRGQMRDVWQIFRVYD